MTTQLHLQSSAKKITFNSTRFARPFFRTMVCTLALLTGATGYAQLGTWTQLATNAPHANMGVMLLLTDGTVIAHNTNGGGVGKGWDKLTPNASGSYVNGTWTSIASMANDRLFFPTQVLPNGKVFAAGGEYGTGATHGEVYDPVANAWTATGAVPSNQNIYDGNSQILANGQVLVGIQNGLNPSFNNAFYNPATNTWATAPTSPLNHDEAAWLKLPDGSTLFVGINSTSSCRYIPATNTWVADATCPVQLYDPYGEEAGAALMLPNGKAIFFGSTGHNAIYTPSGNTSPGTWTVAANFPITHGTQVGTVDAPAAMMPNGKILCCASPINTSSANQFLPPTYFYEYDYLTNTFTQITQTIPSLTGDSLGGINCDFVTFLLLPTGQVLMGINQAAISQRYWVYTPSGANIPGGKPTINGIYQTACGNNFYITGKLFNGISEGAAFGDDWAMSTNYPIVRLSNGPNVYYAKTTNWNRIGAVRTDSLEDTAQFAIPASLPAGTYSLVVIANGFPSNPITFDTYRATASAVANVSCNGGNNGNAQATVYGGNSPYTYSWSNGVTTNPTGAVLSAGTYTVTVTDRIGCTTTATVTITQPPPLTLSTGSIVNVTCNGGNNGSATATAGGGTPGYTYSWAPSGGNAATANNLAAGTYTVTVTDNNGCTNQSTANITQPTVLTANSSATSIACNGGNATVTVTGSGGTPPYSGTGTFTVTAGTYTYTVTDANNCSTTTSITVTEPAVLTANSSATSIACNGGNATVTVTGSGGTPSYSGTGTFTVTAGTYTYTVTDANNCTTTTSITVTEPAVLTANSSATSIACNGGNATVTVTGSGGTPPYSGDGTFSVIAGTYTYTVTDASNCTTTTTITVTEPAALSAAVTSTTNPTTCSGADGSINISVSGGTTAYTYQWSNSSANQNLNGIPAGNYNCTVTDANGCTTTVSSALSDPNPPAVALAIPTDTVCNTNGSFVLTGGSPAGGTYSGTAVTGGSFNPAAAGMGMNFITYSYTDPATGCSATATDSIDVQNCTGISMLAQSNLFSLLPNPNNGTFALQLNATESANVLIYDALGKLVMEQKVQPHALQQFNIATPGIYFVTVITADAQRSTQRILVTQ